MVRAGVGRAETIPLRIEPEVGQVPEYGCHSPKSVICGVFHFPSVSVATVVKQSWDVFEEDEEIVGLIVEKLSEDSGDVRPDPSIIVGSLLLTSDRERLTRKARSDDINNSAPSSSVEGSQIIPLSKLSERSFKNARRHAPGDASFPFHHTDGPVLSTDGVERGFDAEFETVSPCT